MKKKETYLIYLLAAATLVFLAQRGSSPRAAENEFTMNHPSFPPVVISAEPVDVAAGIKGWNDPIERERFNPVTPMRQGTEPESGVAELQERRSIGALVDGVVGLGEMGSLESNERERNVFSSYRLRVESHAARMAKVSE